MDKDNLTFEYALESANQDFQEHLSGLLEIHSQIGEKIAYSMKNAKPYISFSMDEAKLLQSFLLTSCSRMGADYDHISNALTIAMKNHKILEGLYLLERNNKMGNAA